MRSIQKEKEEHGLGEHSFMSVSHRTPVNPCPHKHLKQFYGDFVRLIYTTSLFFFYLGFQIGMNYFHNFCNEINFQ